MLYWVSDLLNLILFGLIGYRKTVIMSNLKNSFPEKSDQELHEIQNEFCRYFCDLILETIKTLTISPKVVMERVDFKDMDIFERFYAAKQSVIIVMGHYGNWELGGARFSQYPYHQLYVIYHPMRNEYFDRLIYHMRTRLGNKLYRMKETFKSMVKDRGLLTATAFIADQTPRPDNAYWTTFLNQETPVFTGTAKIGKKLNYPIIYVSIKQPKRGYYSVNCELLVEKPALLSEDEISELHTRRLEQDIQEHPAIWLWTHRRWKHVKPPELV
jgi:KDO2-lipid IV(A) lauroyltransferase